MEMQTPKQPSPQITDTETHVRIPLPPVNVELSKLKVQGEQKGSPYIIGSNESFQLSVDIEFSGGSLVDLIVYIGTQIEVTFAVEGFGKATEINLPAKPITTQCNDKKYTAVYSGQSAAMAGLEPGFYKVAALLSVKSPTCSGLGPVAFGYISDVVFQVYA